MDYWVDDWAVDFDYENKQEIIRVPVELDPEAQMKLVNDDQANLTVWEATRTGEYIFENEWQSSQTRKNRTLGLTSAAKEVKPGRRKIAVKVVDIFGNDTMTIVEVSL